MKAIVIEGYGGRDRLRLTDMPDPRPAANEVLIRVLAASVNPIDWKIRQGQLRLLLRLRFPYVPGVDIAGEVVATGGRVMRYKPGDAVVACAEMSRGGGYAELAVAKEGAVAAKPASLGFAEAASLPVAGCAALQALRDKGHLAKGGCVLINGAAGGVGHFAVQIAKAMEASVSATCGSTNKDFVQSLGADRVIDYGREDFTSGTERYDLVFDAVAKSSFNACSRVLARDGRYVTTLPGPEVVAWVGIQRLAGLIGPAKQPRFIMVHPNADDLAWLGQLADQGRLKPHLGGVYPLAQAAEAQEESEKGHARGKLVLEVRS